LKLFFLRHGEAENHATSDAERVLTPRGRADVSQVVNSLSLELDELELIVTSPYRRARETSQIALQHLGAETNLLITKELEPSSESSALLQFICSLKVESALFVSHQPLLGEVISRLTGDDAWLTVETANLLGLEMVAPVPGFSEVFCSAIPLRNPL